MRRPFVYLIAAMMTGGAATADIDTAARHVPSPEIVGEARLKVLFWKLYDAALYAPEGEYSPAEPFALTLTYLRKLDGDKIADKTIDEIRKQGFTDEETMARWLADLTAIIPDVTKDSTITGVRDAASNTLFYLDGEEIGRIQDPAFTRCFFDIWLGDNSSRPKMRDRLLGMG